MNHGNITEATEPFRRFQEFTPVNIIDDANRSISAACEQYGFDTFIIQHLLKVFCTFLIGTTKCKISFPDAVADLYAEAPFFYFE